MKKITIILLHYNQKKYIYEALDSILMQTYKNIELIINDDCSKDFDETAVKKYVEKNQKGNIKLVINKNKENIGIVKSINRCVKLATGDYISFFAADDALNNSEVVTNYVKCFEKDPRVSAWSLQCLMYDTELKEMYYKYVTPKVKKIASKYSSKKMFSLFCSSCVFAIGATVFKRKMLLENPFNEEYPVIEDWPYYISMSRKGYIFGYHDFDALNHRDGGISHNTTETPLLKKYRRDLIHVYEREVFPYFNNVSLRHRLNIIDNYDMLLEVSKYRKNRFKGNSSYKITRFVRVLIRKIRKELYNPKNLINYLYILIPCVLVNYLYKNMLFTKLFFWIISIPIFVLIVIHICLSTLKLILRILRHTSDDDVERK